MTFVTANVRLAGTMQMFYVQPYCTSRSKTACMHQIPSHQRSWQNLWSLPVQRNLGLWFSALCVLSSSVLSSSYHLWPAYVIQLAWMRAEEEFWVVGLWVSIVNVPTKAGFKYQQFKQLVHKMPEYVITRAELLWITSTRPFNDHFWHPHNGHFYLNIASSQPDFKHIVTMPKKKVAMTGTNDQEPKMGGRNWIGGTPFSYFFNNLLFLVDGLQVWWGEVWVLF